MCCVTDGHEVPHESLTSHEEHVHGILTEIQDRQDLSQRSLSANLGIALGLTNLLVRKVVRKGWVRATRNRRNRVRYMLTPTGLAEKARMSSSFLQNSIRAYVNARDRVRQRLAEASQQLSGRQEGSCKRVAMFGAGEVAEIAYVCLQETDMKLVAVFGEGRTRLFGLPVQPTSNLSEQAAGNEPFDQLIVTLFEDVASTQAQLDALGVPKEKRFWL